MTVRKLVEGLVGMAALLGGGLPLAVGQEMTEQYIPIGQSPGVSGTASVIGRLQSVNAEARTCAVTAPTGVLSVTVTERTKIWLDRSQSRQPNLPGTFADLRPGATVEVKPEDPQRGVGGPAAWIKVQVP